MPEENNDINALAKIEQDLAAAFSLAIYPEVGTGSVNAILYAALGLGEAGEVQGKVKKILRDDNGVLTDQRRAQIIDELGDCVWYANALANELGVSLADVVALNLAKLQGRAQRGTLGGSGDNR